MSAWDRPGEPPGARQVMAVELEGVPGHGGINPLAALLAAEIAACLRGISDRRIEDGKAPLSSKLATGAQVLTETAVGAIEGTLKGKSLDGALKEAQILALHAEVRERNANATRTSVAIARERLQLVLETFAALGVDPASALTQEGLHALLVGDGLSAPT